MDGIERLERFIKEKSVDAEIIRTDDSVDSSRKTASAINESEDLIAKSICLTDGSQMPIVVILSGNHKIDLKKLRKELKLKNLRLANDDELLRLTGYERGGIPPIGYEARFIMEKDLLDRPVLYCGGGTKNSILKIRPGEIIRIDKPEMMDIKR